MNHETHMRQALALARQALDNDEFPVGCVVVHQDRVIAQGRRINTRLTIASELDHAEIVALQHLQRSDASADRGQMTIYATMEPCLMCYSAILLSRIGALVYAYEDAMGGGTRCDLSQLPELYRESNISIVPGICRTESLALFQAYFQRQHLDYWRDSLLARYTLAQKLE